jgi:inorganic pyrophosphatase
MYTKRLFISIFLFALLLSGCQRPAAEQEVDYKSLPALTDEGINIVVEIPAGTNHKIEYQTESHSFAVDQLQGSDRVIRFLPYPGNYGFIPSTYMDPERGGDGDALDVLLLSESYPTGSVVEAIPMGALRLKDEGEIDTKIIAVPVDPAQRIIDTGNFRDFLIEYDPAKRIIEEWFLNYKGLGAMELLGWEDETYAMDEIRRWAVN